MTKSHDFTKKRATRRTDNLRLSQNVDPTVKKRLEERTRSKVSQSKSLHKDNLVGMFNNKAIRVISPKSIAGKTKPNLMDTMMTACIFDEPLIKQVDQALSTKTKGKS